MWGGRHFCAMPRTTPVAVALLLSALAPLDQPKLRRVEIWSHIRRESDFCMGENFMPHFLSQVGV
jgi:hypothetical protein